jgi:hypothetical protein
MRQIIQASILLAGIAGAALAQPPVAPTPETVGSARGENWNDYNITNSFETGYRFAEVFGNDGKYRSDVNYRNGIRLLSSGFSMNSKDGHGGLFDEILLNTLGLGGDPYEFANLRIQKNRLYRYDMLWRLDEYYNPALTISFGEHFRNTSRRMQDHDLVLFPQSKIQFRFGYSRNDQDGPALSTVQLFNSRGDIFTPFMDVRRLYNEFRIGNDIELKGFKFSWLHAWDNFKEDSTYQLGAAQPFPPGPTSLNSFNRVDPAHGNSPFWRGNLNGERKRWATNARITYVGAQRNFALNEDAVGFMNRNSMNLQTLVSGNASRPTTAGDFLLSFFPTDRLTITNNTSVYTTRISGQSLYNQYNNATNVEDVLFFQFLGIRTITNSTDINYRFSPMVSLYGGYHYSERQIRSSEQLNFPEFPGPFQGITTEQSDHINAGLGGLRLRPIKPLTIMLEGELSFANHPFTPIADRNFHAIRARVQYKAKNLLLSGAYLENYNTNSITVSVHSSRARTYSFNASWTPHPWFSLDAGYSKLHLDSVSGIAFFAGGQEITGFNSIYISNIHAANLGARFAIKKRADLYVGYTITRDTGDGRSAPFPPGTTDPVTTLLDPAQTFPLSFQSPLARLSVRLSPKVRWNVGWQFYNYHEDFQVLSMSQNYHANTGYSSVLWEF